MTSVATRISAADIEIGTELPPAEFPIGRGDQVRYCGAHSDWIGVHWSERAARKVGLRDVVTHGPLTEAKMLSVVSAWVGDPGAIVTYTTRFTKPLYLPDDDNGTVFHVTAVVTGKPGGNRVELNVVATSPQDGELAHSRVVVQLHG